MAVLILSLGWVYPVIASAPNTQSIPSWSDVYVWPVAIINYTKINLEPTGFDPYSCISFAKAVLGRSQSEKLGNARDIEPNSEAFIGAVALTTEGKGHAGVITDLTSEEITIIEANYILGRITQRTLKRDNPKIRGYWTYQQDK